MCRSEPLTDFGKMVQLAKMLSMVILPMIVSVPLVFVGNVPVRAPDERWEDCTAGKDVHGVPPTDWICSSCIYRNVPVLAPDKLWEDCTAGKILSKVILPLIVSVPLVLIGMCRSEPLTDFGKRVQLAKMLSMMITPLIASVPLVFIGMCRSEPLTDFGKRVQLAKMLSMVILPLMGLWGYSVFLLSEEIASKQEIQMVSLDSGLPDQNLSIFFPSAVTNLVFCHIFFNKSRKFNKQ